MRRGDGTMVPRMAEHPRVTGKIPTVGIMPALGYTDCPTLVMLIGQCTSRYAIKDA